MDGRAVLDAFFEDHYHHPSDDLSQPGKIEPVLTDCNTAAVDNTVEAESKAIFFSKSVVALKKKPDETAPDVTQFD